MMEDYLELFISELEEYIKQLNKHLLKLETNNKDSEAISEIFRIFHTIKGMAQTMGFDGMAAMTHDIEDILQDAKRHSEINPRLVDFFFGVTDILTKSTEALRKKKELPEFSEFIDTIQKIKEGKEWTFIQDRTKAKELGEIRIKMKKLDTLFNLTNELMIIRSRISKLSRELGNSELVDLSENASRLISSLHDEVMRLRMLPLSTVFDFFPRWFRDEAKRQHKDVSLEIIGGEIEVDRSIIDVLKELLLHLLRNALDHGIEAGNKKEKAKVVLKAEREREKIMISVIDNGRGIDVEEIKTKALEKGLVTEAELKYFTRSDFFRLLTRPDFSTREEVSTISGRGIGLDIVERTVVNFGGKLIIASEKGKGSSFTLELPLSLAVIRTMIFKLDGQRFALPLNHVQETFYVDENMIKSVYHRELFPLRNEILPLVRLGDRLGCAKKEGRKSVIVVQYQGKRRGYITDEIIDEDEIVIKRLDPLAESSLYSGCSIYADGLPILIIDPRGFE